MLNQQNMILYIIRYQAANQDASSKCTPRDADKLEALLKVKERQRKATQAPDILAICPIVSGIIRSKLSFIIANED
jgi:hypothetical protein